MRDSVRQKMVEKARDLLFTMNYDEITMNLIATELGITAPTIYHYFKGKEELINAGYDLITEEINNIPLIRFPSSMPPEMKIMTVTGLVTDYFMKTGIPALFLVENLHDKPIDLNRFRKKFEEMIEAYIKKSKRNIKVSAGQLTYRYLGMLASDIAYLRKNNKKSSDDFAEKVFAALF
jgi:AcrR family transcriptional regulator